MPTSSDATDFRKYQVSQNPIFLITFVNRSFTNINDMVTTKKIDHHQKNELQFIRRIYENSFPPDERRDFGAMIDLIETQTKFTVALIEKGDQAVGFITYWKWPDFIYIEHFAIDQDSRSNGLGTQILNRFIEQTDQPIVLEVELPENDLCKKRISFYERIGFTLHPEHHYIQPPYSKDKQPMELLLMTYGLNTFETQQFENVRHKLYTDVYQYSTDTIRRP